MACIKSRYIYFKLLAFYELIAYLKATNIEIWPWVGPVPIVVTPFFKLDAELTMIPITIYEGITCTYKQLFGIKYIGNNAIDISNNFSNMEHLYA